MGWRGLAFPADIVRAGLIFIISYPLDRPKSGTSFGLSKARGFNETGEGRNYQAGQSMNNYHQRLKSLPMGSDVYKLESSLNSPHVVQLRYETQKSYIM